MKEKEILYITDFISKANRSCVKFKSLNRIQGLMNLLLEWLKQKEVEEMIQKTIKDVQNNNSINCTSRGLLI